ncbi:hypothetical protein TNCT_359891 [Trichonephila clavata]|uniref:Uncharacterized protein n=1 Tax=Trichonephila clavata TaxID=2740835 RepID=A0A8X6KJF3_TRICU|nr:hypothetical protein TNCT_359891 [Trichonephila clavata]
MTSSMYIPGTELFLIIPLPERSRTFIEHDYFLLKAFGLVHISAPNLSRSDLIIEKSSFFRSILIIFQEKKPLFSFILGQKPLSHNPVYTIIDPHPAGGTCLESTDGEGMKRVFRWLQRVHR